MVILPVVTVKLAAKEAVVLLLQMTLGLSAVTEIVLRSKTIV